MRSLLEDYMQGGIRVITSLLVFVSSVVHAAEPIDFNRDIRPILSNNCFKCHGPDESLREAGLRLDVRGGATKELESGSTAIVPNKPDASELVARILSDDADVMMPPPSSNKQLSAEEKQRLQEWIRTGAEYREHWAFIKPARPEPPQVEGAEYRVSNPIDNFVADRLRQAGLPMSPEADRYTLIRRVYLDLIGIPPTIEETDAFINDNSPDAYEKVVERLLASPQYGERWARRWLDLARYSDSNGYEKDRARSMWPYRDWVIKTLNDDMPFDQFSIRQIAGDMLPGATLDDVVATGFHRNTMINEEGGIDPQEFRFYANVDRVGTTGAIWLGLTVGCAQCHTHKYDPIVHKEFYQMLSYFDEADEPTIDVPTPELSERRAKIERRIATAEAALPTKFTTKATYEFIPLHPITVASDKNTTLSVLEDGAVLASEAKPSKDTYTVTFDLPAGLLGAQGAGALRVEALTDDSLSQRGPGRRPNGNFVLTGLSVTVAPLDRLDDVQEIEFSLGEADVSQPDFTPDGVLDSDPHTGWAIHDPAIPDWNQDRKATFYFEKPLHQNAGVRVVVKLDQQYGEAHTLGKFRLSIGAIQTESQSGVELAEKAFENWVQEKSKQAVHWTVLKPGKMTTNLPFLELLSDGSILASGDQTKFDVYDLTFDDLPSPVTAIRLEVLPDESLPGKGPGRVYYEGTPGDFFLNDLALTVDGQRKSFRRATESFAAGGNVAAYAIDDKADTHWSIGRGVGQRHAAVFQLSEPLVGAKSFELKLTSEFYYAVGLGRFRISVTSDTQDVETVGMTAEVESLLTQYPESRERPEFGKVFQYWLSVAPELAKERRKIVKLRNSMPGYPTTLVMRQRPADRYRETKRHHRGEFLQPKEPVEKRAMHVLHPFPSAGSVDRLAFAKWLVSRDNPLVARVTVNRHWAALFGSGIVRTTEDFGTQGDLPTHPELLDWLALEFMDRGWSQKAIHRLLVTSATYRQSSLVTPKLAEADPQNRLFTRGPRVRLEAELVRDSVLASAGLLSKKLGGPSVFPPQLPVVTTEGSYVAFDWNVSKGEDRYRRSLYTFSKRTAPFAMFAAFDAPSGEACVPRRDVSNTPLQSLTLLNDGMFMEAAEALGKAAASSDRSVAEKISVVFRRCLVRPPQPEELAMLQRFVEAQQARFKDDDKKVWTALARAVINLDESVVKQ